MAWLASALACGDSASVPGSSRLEGYRSSLGIHKVQLDAEKAAELEKQGARVLGDYGSYKLVQVDDATLDSLSPEKGTELRDDYNHILLNAGVIDTASEYARSLRGMKKNAAGKGFHIVHFDGPVKAEWLEELEATGVRVVTYIPNNAYLVYGDATAMGSLQKHIAAAPAIRWDGEYLDDYKLDPTVQTVATPAYSVQLIKDEETNGATLELIRKLQTREAIVQEALDYVNVVAFVDRQALNEIVQRPDVLSIQPRPLPRKFDERQNMILSGQLTGNAPSGATWLAWLASKGFTQAQFTASGFGVDVTDSGIDNGTPLPNHFGLYLNGDVTGTSRVVYNRLEGTPNTGSTIQGCDGHGNLNAHIVAGFSNQSGAPFADAAGFHYGLGVAPFVKVGSSVVFDPGDFTSPNYENLQSRAYRDGMRISSNSWGSNANTYTADSQRYDALVRDAQPTASAVPNAGNQEMIIVFAAGNNGSSANTVGSPGTAKNVITVGASENVQAFGGADACGTTDAEANSAYDIVAFSSRGPASDGRKKPDIMAPGTHVSGGVAQAAGQRASPPAIATGQKLSCFDASGVCGGPSSDYFPVTQQWYTASSGTSHATPAVAGGTALLRQYFINQGVTPPSPAMTKAYLMNSTRYMTGVGANDSLWSTNQGMGLMDLGMAFDGVPRLVGDQTPASLFTASGQTSTFNTVVADSTKPFRVTVAWTDAPGSTTGSAWKNNLDLTVTVGTSTYKGNVFTGANSTTGGTADSSNNVESVFLPAGTEGAVTVTVTAANINSDGVPNNASSMDQDFAIVAYNACNNMPAAPTGVTATVSGSNRVDIQWTVNGAAAYHIYRATTAGGPYTRVGTAVAPPFSDTGLSGGTTYYYVVRAKACAESPKSNEASVTATGMCALPPSFAGLSSASNNAQSTCANTLSWSAATPSCGGALTYSVYRGTTPGFTPSATNRLATGVTGTSYLDDANLADGTPYYYVVRATEVSSATLEDTNTVEKAATPTGTITPGVRYFDDFDSSRPANASAYWIPTVGTGSAATMAIVSGCHYQSATNAYRFGAASTACGGTYPISQQHTLVLGGNGSVSSTINGFSIPASAINPQMTFNIWYSFEARYDGAWLAYSTTGPSGPWINVGDAAVATAPYISAGGYDNTLNSSSTTRSWTTTTAGSSGTNGALKAVTVNLAALAGQKVWFGFKFYSDSTSNYEGFYVDDVRINADQVATCSPHVPPPGPVAAYKVTGVPASVLANTPVTFSLTAVDAVGVVATGYSGSASFTSSDAAAVLPSTATFSGGVASGLSATFKTVGSQSLTAKDTATPSISGSSTTHVRVPTNLVITTQPSHTVAGTSISPAITVGLLDQDGNPVAAGSFNVTLSIANNAGGGSLSGTTTVAMSSGVATFSSLSIDKAGTGYTLKASSSGFPDVASSAFNITPAAAAKLGFMTQPSTTLAGASITPAVQVAIQDAFGNPTASTASISLALSGGPVGATLSGTTTVAAVGGVATFGNLSIAKAGSGYTLVASSGSFTNATSSAFNVQPNTPTQLAFKTGPSSSTAGSTLAPVEVEVLDAHGNRAAATSSITLSLLGGSGATLGGTTTVAAVSGVATFSDLTINKAANGYSLSASASGLTSATSGTFNITSGVPAALFFTVQPGNATAGVAFSPAVKVSIVDSLGNVVAATSNITLSLQGGSGGTLGGTTTVAATAGVATFADLFINKAANGYSLSASATGLTSATSSVFNVQPNAPTQLAFKTGPSSATAGSTLAPVEVEVLDAHGNRVAATSSITLSLQGGSGGTLGGTTTVAAVSGVATFSSLFINKAANGYSLSASATGLTSATSGTFNITPGAAAALSFSVQPGNATAGVTFSPAVKVSILDSLGNLVTGASDPVSLSLQGGSGGTLGGTTTVAATAGVATFADLFVNKAANGYSLSASATGLTSATSGTFNVTPGAAAALSFSVQPGNATAGVTFSPAVKVSILDSLGNLVTGASDPVSLALSGSGATLGGTTTVAAVSGVATFSNLSIAKAGSGYTLVASSGSLANATSSAFNVQPNAPTQLAFKTGPSGTTVGSTLAPVEVEILDAHGNRVASTSSITLLLLGGSGGAALGGTTTVAAVSGVATFSNLTINKAANGYTLNASASGLTSATSNAFNISSGVPAALSFSVPPGNATAGVAFSPAVKVAIVDSFGNVITSASDAITLVLGSNPGGATLGGSTTVAAVSGVATFPDLTLNRVGSGYTLIASSGSLASATSSAFNVQPNAPAQLVFKTGPSSTTAGSTLAPVEVEVLDAHGNRAAATSSITLSLLGGSGGTLGGTTTVAAVSGVATFPNLSVNKAANGYSLSASATGLTSATSGTFNITPGAAVALSFTAQPSHATAGVIISPAVKVSILDSLGNEVAATSNITLSLQGGSGATLGGTTTVAAVSGVATFSNLSVNKAANGYSLSASASGLTSATSGTFNITPGAAAALSFTVQPSNATAGVAFSPAVKVSILDALGNLVTGASDAVSLALSGSGGATLGGTTTVAAVSGVATFPDLTLNRVGSGYTLVASSGSLANATSSAFNVQPNAPAQLVFKTGPSSTTAGSTLAPVEVEVLDAHGNRAAATSSITLSLLGGSGGTLGGTTTVAAVSGVATFSNLSVNKAANGYSLSASASGLTSATSGTFNITPGAAAALSFSVQPGNATAGVVISPAIKVSILDSFGNVITSASDSITLVLGSNPGGATLGGTTTVAAINGVATFPDLTLNRAARGYTLQASSGVLPAVTSTVFNVTSSAAARLVFRSAPSNVSAAASLAPIVVELQDALGNVLTDSTTQVTLSLGTNPTGGTLLGTTSVFAVNGVATFEGLALRKAGTGYTLEARAQGSTSATSTAFNVTPGPAASYTLVFPVSVTAGQEATLSATAYDAYGNVATTYAGSIQVTSSDAAAVLPAHAAFTAGVLNGLKVTFLSPGFRTLTLTDAEQPGLSGTVQTNVTAFAQPTVQVTEPAGGSEVSGHVRITATGAVAPGTRLVQLSILVDGVVIASGQDATLTATWDTSGLPGVSSHTLTAVISDSAGNVANSAPVGITVKNEVKGDDTGCGCGATSGADASVYLGLFALARYVSVRRRAKKAA
ncbi:S8 family serine peptidase [Vitiosangium sp. GDMCC 1.1324]|uniref:S8 family serine peptidase n=1 Tax=Vitiosangium sp. (strain GDMCC 1.1324) TaxID=2138576 RepID=UPI001E2F179D|nr:S8 family serine peptidase [Vitiosangium sp. GDMCC 1.1324]